MAAPRRDAFRASLADQPTAPLTSRSTTRRRERSLVAARGESASIAFPLVVGAVHWMVVQLAASLAYFYGTSRSDSRPFSRDLPMPPMHDGIAHVLVDPLRTWDGLWYRLVALEGYDPRHAANAAFWPLFPWSMRALSRLTGMTVDTAGYLIANVSFVVALVLLYRLVRIDFDERIARGTLWAIALFPTAFFFSAVYTESPFLMLVVGSLYAAKRGNWWVAGLVGALAALTRSYGVFLVLPLAVLFIQERGLYIRRLVPTGLFAALPVLGPALFTGAVENRWERKWTTDWFDVKWRQLRSEPVAFLEDAIRWLTHEPGWMTVQLQWNRFSSMPWDTLRYAFSQSPEGRKINVQDGANWSWIRVLLDDVSWATFVKLEWRDQVANSDTLELVCTLGFIVLALIGIWKLPLYMTLFLIPGLLVPLFQPSSVHVLMSMPRFGLTLFPLFVMIAILLAGRGWLAKPLAVFSTTLLVLLTIQFSNWYWVS